MRKLVIIVFSALAFAAAVAPPAFAQSSPSPRLSLTAKVKRFHATSKGVVADGTLTGRLASGSSVSHQSAPVQFAVQAKPQGGQCDVLTLHLATLNLELLGVQVHTSTINLDVYALHGQVLGNLFCALDHAKVTFPKSAVLARALNARLHGHSLPVFSASQSVSAGQPIPSSPWLADAKSTKTTAAPSCQVLRLVLGPLNLDLLGLVVDLYGQTHSSPVTVTIDAIPSQGLLGQLLCGLAGGTGVDSLGGLQTLLNTLGINLSPTQIQGVLTQLGITNISSGLSEADLQRILQALGLGSTVPAG